MKTEFNLQHLVLVRHGESEGDVRRANARKGIHNKHDAAHHDEGLTENGIEQSRLAGAWIAKHVLEQYGLEFFDEYLVSPTLRTKQTAEALDPVADWKIDDLLDERDRGLICGLSDQDHATKYPESYRQMHQDPLHWLPPEGKSIMSVADRVSRLLEITQTLTSCIWVTHRDLMWASLSPLEGMPENDLQKVNTDMIENGQIVHYMSINPDTSVKEDRLIWKRTTSPQTSEVVSNFSSHSNRWIKL